MRDVGRNFDINEGLVSGNTPALVNAMTPRVCRGVTATTSICALRRVQTCAGVSPVREDPASASLTIVVMVDDATFLSLLTHLLANNTGSYEARVVLELSCEGLQLPAEVFQRFLRPSRVSAYPLLLVDVFPRLPQRLSASAVLGPSYEGFKFAATTPTTCFVYGSPNPPARRAIGTQCKSVRTPAAALRPTRFTNGAGVLPWPQPLSHPKPTLQHLRHPRFADCTQQPPLYDRCSTVAHRFAYVTQHRPQAPRFVGFRIWALSAGKQHESHEEARVDFRFAFGWRL
ncbi:hypothetical protein GALMADRAFT_138786 [Galerina marginata CBS 339.88]|uniref:Uncharacterized protein n=1 Tax=Galerina marginata (strain CBS 339.88) TaxID=685588 RepID=A0A067TCU1_GALM3|nr:hypothetical protein GALMADRAFT_138786 [Galerina marginata CBS 339.88]